MEPVSSTAQWFEFGTSLKIPGGFAAQQWRVTFPQGIPVSSALCEIVAEGSPVNRGVPRLTILAPQPDQVIYFNDGIDVTGYVDNSVCAIYVDDKPVSSVDGHFVTPIRDQNYFGTHLVWNMKFSATDPQGQQTVRFVRVFLKTKPTLSVSPADGTITTQDSIAVSGTVAPGDTPVSDIVVKVNGVTVPSPSGAFSTTVPLEVGLNAIVITATCPNGVETVIRRAVIRDAVGPEFRINSHFDGDKVDEASVTLAGTVGELQDFQVTVAKESEAPQQAVVANDAFTFAGLSLHDGENRITVTATEVSSGRTAQTVLVLWLNTTPPALAVSTPDNGEILNTATVTVNGTVTDDLPVTVLVNGLAAVVTEGGAFSIDVPLVEGPGTITVTAVDEAGNEAAPVTREVTRDTIAPEPFVVTASPSGWTTDNTPELAFCTTDSGTGVDHYGVLIDGDDFGPASSPYVTPPLADGEHLVTILAVDRAGNVTTAEVSVYVDTTAPAAPEVLRVIPGRDRIRIVWTPSPDSDVVSYRVERAIEGDLGQEVLDPITVARDTCEIEETGLEYATVYQYRVVSVDRVALESEPTQWKGSQVAIAEGAYDSEVGGLVEYDRVMMVVPKEALPPDVAKIRIQEVESENFAEKATNPIWSPIYEFSVIKEGATEPETGVAFEQGVMVRLNYDPAVMWSGVDPKNLGVYYFDEMFGQWFRVRNSGVDPTTNTIYFVTNHFTSFSIQPTLVQDLSPQEYKDMGISPLKSYVEYNGITVSPQGGTASTSVTELVLPGLNGFDLELKRTYDTGTARADALSLDINVAISLSLAQLKNIGLVKEAVTAGLDLKNILAGQISALLQKFITSQGDYAFSMGQGWRLNLPYVKPGSDSIYVRLPDGSMHSVFEMKLVDSLTVPDAYRELTFEQHEGADFTFYMRQVYQPFNISVPLGEGQPAISVMRNQWVGFYYEVRMKDGTVYEFGSRDLTDFDIRKVHRITRIVDPTGKNVISFHYNTLNTIDYIEDSVGRRVHFDYELTLMWPRISRIWIEGDPYNRAIEYEQNIWGVLESARDVGGRVSTYSYGDQILFASSVGATVDFFSLVLNLVISAVGTPLAGNALSAIIGPPVTLFGSFSVQWMQPLETMTAPGQGISRLEYKVETFMYGSASLKWFWFIPTELTLSINAEQRFLTRKVSVYKASLAETPVKVTSYQYELAFVMLDQPYVQKTTVTEAKKETVYHYAPKQQSRFQWVDKSITIPGTPISLSFPSVFWRIDMLSVNDTVEVRSLGGTLLDSTSYAYDGMMRPTEQINTRGSSQRRITFAYDNWGNVKFQHDTGGDFATDQDDIWTWIGHVNTDYVTVDSSDFRPDPYGTRPVFDFVHDRPLFKATKIGTPVSDDGESGYLYSTAYYQYTASNQLAEESV